MTTHIQQLIISYAEILNLPIVFREDENGNVILESEDKVDLFGVYKQLIQEQISNKMLLIDQLQKKSKLFPTVDLERLRMQDEALKLKREALDLQVEYVAKSDYIFHYQGRVEFFKKHAEMLSEKVNKELPDLVKQAQEILGDAVTLTTKNHAILTGLLAQFSSGVNTQNEKNNLYTSMKNMVQVMGKKDDFKKPVLRNQQLDNLVMDFYNADSRSKMKLTVDELKLVNRPITFVKQGFLDEKLIVASKLGKKVFIVIINEDSGMTDKEFGMVFRQPFVTKEKNLAIAEIATENGLVVVGDESVSRYLTKADMFLSSGMYEILKTMKKIKAKGSYHARATRDTKDFEDKEELISHTIKSMLLTYKTDSYVKAMGIKKSVQFAVMCILYLEAIPLSVKNIGDKIKKYFGTIDSGQVGSMRLLNSLNYVEQTKLGYSSAGGKEYRFPAKGWVLSSTGRDLVVNVINRIINDLAQ